MQHVSIIIATYNYAEFLLKALDTALKQSYQDFEIIIINDGSTDGTEQIVAEYIKKHPNKAIRYIYQENKGLPSALNVGIRKAKYDLIAFLDADDLWYLDKLYLQVRHLEENKQLGMVASLLEYIDKTGRKTGFSCLKRGLPSNGMLLKHFFDLPPIIPSSVIVRKQVFDRVGLFDEELKVALDTDIFMKIAMLYPVGLINLPLVKYRRHYASLNSRTYEPYIHARLLENFKSAASRLKRPDKVAIRRIYAELYIDYAESLFQYGDFKTARAQVLNHFRYNGISVKGLKLFLKSLLPSGLIFYLRRLKKQFVNQAALL